MVFDERGRAIVNVRWIVGRGHPDDDNEEGGHPGEGSSFKGWIGVMDVVSQSLRLYVTSFQSPVIPHGAIKALIL